MRWDLVTLDLDGTLLPDDTAFAAILRENGRAEDVEASDARFFAGKLSLEDCFGEQWEWVKALSLADMHRGLRKATWLPDIGEAARRLRQSGTEVCVLTDQPSVVTDFLGRWGLTDAICSPVTVHEGMAVDVDARFDKWANLHGRLHRDGIDPKGVCHVGNGANDVTVWQRVGGSIAVFAAPEVAQEAHTDAGRPRSLLDLLPLLQS